MVLSATLPTAGVGALKNREDPKILGTSKESNLLQAASTFYKTFAIECSRAQVSVDMFLFSSTYQDVASHACLPHYTSGQTYYYPSFNAARSEDAVKFAREFGEVIAMPIMLEAITRVRASRGIYHWFTCTPSVLTHIQAYGCPRSTGISSFARLIFWQCQLSPLTSRMPLRCRLKKL
jgi:hypothetical protein